MKIGWLRVFGLAIAIALAFVFFTVIQQHFPHFPQQRFQQFPINMTLIPIEQDVGQEVSTTLWAQRQLDLIALAFILFATATCCRAILRVKEGKSG